MSSFESWLSLDNNYRKKGRHAVLHIDDVNVIGIAYAYYYSNALVT